MQSPRTPPADPSRAGARRAPGIVLLWLLANVFLGHCAPPLLGSGAFLLLGARLAHAAPDETNWSFLKPSSSAERLSIDVCGNEWTYYRLDYQNPVEFSAQGPRRVKLITRNLSIKQGRRRTSYTIRVTRGAGHKEIFLKEIFAEEAEEVVCTTTGDPVGEGETNILHVPRGKWEFRVEVLDEEVAVAIRLLREETRHGMLVSCAPSSYDRQLILVQPSGNEYPHYHFTSERPLVLTLIGPARISIRTRLDFGAGAHDVAPYGIEVIGWPVGDAEPAESIREVAHFWTRRLEQAVYKEAREISPGGVMEMEMDVPAGDWTFEIRPVDIEVPGVAARILVPKSALAKPPPQ